LIADRIPLKNPSGRRSGQSPTLQKSQKSAYFQLWRDDLRVVRGVFQRNHKLLFDSVEKPPVELLPSTLFGAGSWHPFSDQMELTPVEQLPTNIFTGLKADSLG
jgi:hypothetical protein